MDVQVLTQILYVVDVGITTNVCVSLCLYRHHICINPSVFILTLPGHTDSAAFISSQARLHPPPASAVPQDMREFRFSRGCRRSSLPPARGALSPQRGSPGVTAPLGTTSPSQRELQLLLELPMMPNPFRAISANPYDAHSGAQRPTI